MLALLSITPRAVRLGLSGTELDRYPIIGVWVKSGGYADEYDGRDLGNMWECVCGYQGSERFDEFGWAEMAGGGDDSVRDDGHRLRDDGDYDVDGLRE